MRPIRSLLIYFAVVFPGGALLAPCLYRLAQWAARHDAHLAALAACPFSRFLDRSLLGLALLCLWPLLRSGAAPGWRNLGFVPQDRPARQFLGGFAWGWASLAAVALPALACGAFTLDLTLSAAGISRHLAGAAWAAVLVAVLEELLFRGALFGMLRQSMPWPSAAVVSSAVYSAVHFIKHGGAPMPVQWDSGLALLWRMLAHPPPLVPAFFTLFVAGSILALSYQRAGALYFPIGLHAGWIFWLKSCRLLFHPSAATPSLQSFWGGADLIDGWLSFLVLITLFLLIARKKQAGPPP